jgi:protein-S-isoprenylcysteine O-methyltransferase Ste14
MSFENKIPPPIVALLFGCLMWFSAGGILANENLSIARLALAAVAFTLGMYFWIAGVIALRKAKTTINPLKPASASSLVASGIYQISRNPIYVGFAFILATWALMLQYLWSFIGVLGFIMYMNRFQIIPEERAMHALFGDSFENYKNKVRRWL